MYGSYFFEWTRVSPSNSSSTIRSFKQNKCLHRTNIQCTRPSPRKKLYTATTSYPLCKTGSLSNFHSSIWTPPHHSPCQHAFTGHRQKPLEMKATTHTETNTNTAANCSHLAYTSKIETSLLLNCSLKDIAMDKDTLSLCNSYYSSLYDKLCWKPCVQCQMKPPRGTNFTHPSPNPVLWLCTSTQSYFEQWVKVTNCAKHATTFNFPLSKKQQQWALMKI